MVGDGILGEAQPFGDGLVVRAGRHQPQRFDLAAGQLIRVVAIVARRALADPPELINERGHQIGGDQTLAPVHCMNGCQQLAFIAILQQLAARSGFDRLEGLPSARMRAQDDDSRRGILARDVLSGLQPAHPGHVDVHYDHVRLALLGQNYGLSPVRCLRHHSAIVRILADPAQSLAKQAVIIGN